MERQDQKMNPANRIDHDKCLRKESLLKFVKQQAKAFFDDARGSHDWEHTVRVCEICEHIGEKEGADIIVLMISAYLHDIGRSLQDSSNGNVCHAQKGEEMAKPLLRKLELTAEQKENILHCITSHRFRGDAIPETLEAKILFDADKLDAIGAVGVARAFLFAGEVGARLHNTDDRVEDTKPYSIDDTGYREYKVKLCKIADRIITNEGRRIAKDRHGFMVQFFDRFLKEYKGEC